MTALLLALSLSNSFTKVGAIVAFAAIVGIALLAMLFFAQARELKRLREWSEEEPRRMAELEQRLSSALALRIQRATARVARPVASAKGVSAVAGQVGSQSAAHEAPVAGGAPIVEGAPAIKLLPAAPAIIAGNATPGTAAPDARESQDVVLPAAVLADLPEGAEPVVSVACASAGSTSREESQADVGEEVPALVAVAAEASSLTASASPAASAPVAPASAAPVPTASVSASMPAASASAPVPVDPAPSAPRAPTPPPRPTLATPRRPADARPPGAPPPRRSAPPLSNGRSQPPRRRPVRRRGGPPPGPPFLREERSRGRGRLLIAGGAIVAVVLLIVLLTSGGGSSNKSATTVPPATRTGTIGEETARVRTHASETSLPASNPSETHVVVLNGTETGGLAHRLSGNLQQSGYTLATALNGHPSGHSTTVVEYAPGHRTDARHVAQTLGVAQTRLLEPSVAALDGGSATVVVIAGSDLVGTGAGEASTGEAVGGTGQ